MPISEVAKKQFQHLCSADDDQLQDHSIFAEPDYLSSITYKDFLQKHLKVDSEEVLKVLQDLPSGYFGQGIDCIPAMEALGFGLPGINQTSLGSFEGLLRKVLSLSTEPYTFHFPDGNATVARLLVKALIPEIGAGDDMRKIATSKFNYSLLDNPKNQNRVRLNSTVVHVQHVNNNKQVSVTYIQDRQHQRVVAKKVVLACYNMVIPHICPELDTPQKQALKSLVKMPLVYTNILLNNWQAFKNLGVGTFFSPGGWHNMAMLDFPVSMGDVQFSATPNDPIIVHMSKAVTVPGLEPKAQSKAGRYQLLAKSYAEIESDVRQQLDGALGAGGFNSSKDIAAITVNRWPHGYAWTPNSAFDHHVEGQMPNEIGRQTVGRIAIANSDAGASAYLDAAIDQAHRAITELS